MLRLTVFGGVGLRPVAEVEAEAKADMSLPRRGLAMIALLAAGPEVGMSRDLLAALLWPESDEERSRSALRQTLFTLRRDLGVSSLFLGSAELTLDPTAVSSDVRDFETAERAGDHHEMARVYGGPFLDGFHLAGAPEFERWVDGRRADYRARAAAALEALARKAGARGEHGAAEEFWRRLVALDPLNTRLVMECMKAEAAAGNVAGALRQAQTHEELFRDEVGAAPDPALQDLVAHLRSRRPPAPPSAPGPTAPSSTLMAAAPGFTPPERFPQRLARELSDRFVVTESSEAGRDGSTRRYRARDRRHDREVTLKVVHPALASQIDIERFIREIRLTGRLLHPHILPLLDSGEIAGRPWFATPCPEGETLRARLDREARLPVDEAVRLGLELADALAYAHEHGVVHRDVSPENIFLAGPTAGGHALLTNLGFARALDTAAGASVTDTGVMVGSAAYMSPEQAAGSRTVGAPADVYGLAAVLFEALVGEPLFSGPTPQAIMAKRAAEPVPAPSRLHEVPPDIAAVIRKALASDPEDRYGTMRELESALRRPPSVRSADGWSWRALAASLRGWWR